MIRAICVIRGSIVFEITKERDFLTTDSTDITDQKRGSMKITIAIVAARGGRTPSPSVNPEFNQ